MDGMVTGVLYAVIRVNEKRMKTLQDVKGFKMHMEREKKTLNAKEELKDKNKMIIGSNDIYKTMKQQLEGCKLVPNANIGHELILTASKEYFRNINDEQKELWVESNKKFLQETYGQSCVYAQLHVDETTWHIHAVISNRTKNRYGQPTINNSIYFGGNGFKGKEKLRKLQDDYAGAMSQFNLSRGIRFSNATHVQIRQFYSLINDNMSVEKLNRVIDNSYRYNYIKEEFAAITEQLEAFKSNDNKVSINNLKRELYKLSYLVTAPDKLYKEEREYEQRKKVEALLLDNNIPISYIKDIELLTREGHTNRKESNLEQFARQVAENRVKHEVLKLKKILRTMTGEMELSEEQKEKLQVQVKELNKDKEVFKNVIRTLSEYYYIPQEAVQKIIRSAAKEEYKEYERYVERKLEK